MNAGAALVGFVAAEDAELEEVRKKVMGDSKRRSLADTSGDFAHRAFRLVVRPNHGDTSDDDEVHKVVQHKA